MNLFHSPTLHCRADRLCRTCWWNLPSCWRSWIQPGERSEIEFWNVGDIRMPSESKVCSHSVEFIQFILWCPWAKSMVPPLRPKAAKIWSSTWLNGTMHSWPSNLKAGNGIRNWEPTDFCAFYWDFLEGQIHSPPRLSHGFGWCWFVLARFGQIQTSHCRWQHPGWLANLRSAGCGSGEKPRSVAPSWQVTSQGVTTWTLKGLGRSQPSCQNFIPWHCQS